VAVPAELRPFFRALPVLFERLHDFEVVRKMMIDEVRPESFIERLWTLDLLESSSQILRYRQLKSRMLKAHRSIAVEAVNALLQSFSNASNSPQTFLKV
jgi:hypothetical protein